jgi:hypothetical protein
MEPTATGQDPLAQPKRDTGRGVGENQTVLGKSASYDKLAKRTHSAKWDRCVEEVRRRGGVDSPEAVCTAQLGEESYE